VETNKCLGDEIVSWNDDGNECGAQANSQHALDKVTHTHTQVLLILQPDAWIEQTRFMKKTKTKIKIAMSNI